MTTIGKKQIYNKIQQLVEYLKYLQEISQETKSKKQFVADFHFFGLAERYLQLAIQSVIDSVQMIITEEGFKRPNDNQEAIALLYEKKVISKKLAMQLDGIVGFRNILVHEYGDIDHNQVYEYLQNRISDFEEFKKEIVYYIEK